MANTRGCDEGRPGLPDTRPTWSAARVPGAMPFSIVVLADFAAAEPRRSLATRIDLDSQESFLGAFRPQLEIGLPYCGALDLSSAAQLHPDALCALVHGLSALLEARAEAGDPLRMAALADEAGAVLDFDTAPTLVTPRGQRSPASDSALLDDLLGGTRRADSDPVRRLARSLGDAAADRGDHAAAERRRAVIDLELNARLRALLRSPELRRLEALCLGLRALARSAPDPELVQIRVVHAPADALESAADQLAGASFLIAAHGFESDPSGLAQLRALARLAENTGVPALASGNFQGSEWEKLRSEAAAKHIGLFHPHVLARLPYGAATDPIESFQFEELSGEIDATSFVWCDGALAAARALARCATQTGDVLELSRFLVLDDLPVYAGSSAVDLPQAGTTDAPLTERDAEALVARGINPIIAMRGSDQARLPAFHSIDGHSLIAR